MDVKRTKLECEFEEAMQACCLVVDKNDGCLFKSANCLENTGMTPLFALFKYAYEKGIKEGSKVHFPEDGNPNHANFMKGI